MFFGCLTDSKGYADGISSRNRYIGEMRYSCFKISVIQRNIKQITVCCSAEKPAAIKVGAVRNLYCRRLFINYRHSKECGTFFADAAVGIRYCIINLN